jgi:hypothetical protein
VVASKREDVGIALLESEDLVDDLRNAVAPVDEVAEEDDLVR